MDCQGAALEWLENGVEVYEIVLGDYFVLHGKNAV